MVTVLGAAGGDFAQGACCSEAAPLRTLTGWQWLVVAAMPGHRRSSRSQVFCLFLRPGKKKSLARDSQGRRKHHLSFSLSR